MTNTESGVRSTMNRQAAVLACCATILSVSWPESGRAYIDSPVEKLTLPQLVLEFRSIAIIEVERFDAERGAILFKFVERVQGRPVGPALRHSIRYGDSIPTDLKGLKPGQKAVFFSADGYGRGITLVEGAWYISNFESRTAWWQLAGTAANYDFNCIFTGAVPELVDAVRTLLKGEEVVVRARKKGRAPESQLVRYSLRQANRKEVVTDVNPAGPAKPQVPSKEALPNLVEALKDTETKVRVEAALALAGLGAEARTAAPALATLLAQDKDTFVRRAAAVALGQIGPEASSALPALIELLQSHYENADGLLGSECSLAIGKIDPEGKVTVPLLTAQLKDPQVETRIRAANRLALIGLPARSATPALIEALRDKIADVRHAATGALASIGPEARVVVPVFVSALQDENKFVRMTAARALGAMGPEAKDALPALQVATKDKDDEVRQYAADALRRIAGK